MVDKDILFKGSLMGWILHRRILLVFLTHCALLTLSWHSEDTSFLIFLAFIPVFYLIQSPPQSYNERLQAGILLVLGMFFYAYFTIYWIRSVNFISHLILSLIAAVQFSMPLALTMIARTRMNNHVALGSILFASTWLLIEVLHDLNILGFPYFNIGQVLAAYPDLIQWYSLTGSVFGILWIFLVNYALFTTVRLFANKNFSNHSIFLGVFPSVAIILIPIFCSIIIRERTKPEPGDDFRILAVHTAADVYEYKYEVTPKVLLNDYINLTKQYLDSSAVDLVIWPENALTGDIWLPTADSVNAIETIRDELLSGTFASMITGAIASQIVNAPEPGSYNPGILYDENAHVHFRRYNTALFIENDGDIVVKTKKRLVPFGEMIPRQKIFKPLVSILPNQAELKFSSKLNEFPVFRFRKNKVKTTTVICYSSVFSSLVADEVSETDADFLVVILNEGWMKSRKAFLHFNWYSQTRAIENRRSLVKSSNEGSSSIISMHGKILNAITGPQAGAIYGKIKLNNQKTFFTRYWAVIHYGLVILCSAFISFVLVISLFNTKKHRQ